MKATSGERILASGKIDVKTYDPTTDDQLAEGPAIVQYEFLQTQRSDDEASFVGVERVTGSIGGKSGTFVFQDEGTLKGTTVSGTWFVVPGSGTGELRGLRGEGGFKAELGQGADFTLDYWFE